VSGYVVELAPAAEADIREAFIWYRERNALIADAFRTEVFDVVDRIGDAPLAKAADEEGNRKRVLHRFPYSDLRGTGEHRDRARRGAPSAPARLLDVERLNCRTKLATQVDKNRDQLERRVNDFAARSFRDVADRDYIAARLACRAGLMPQFLLSAQQAFEKYLKYVLLVNRIPAKVGHDVAAALQLTEKLSFTIDLHPKSREFIEHVSVYGEYRYLDISYFVDGYVLPKLDLAVWELRRYCQVLDVFGKALPEPEQRLLNKAHANLRASSSREPPQVPAAQWLLGDRSSQAGPPGAPRSGLAERLLWSTKTAKDQSKVPYGGRQRAALFVSRDAG
jgi:HEPN domain-containing protein/plasmid stabilization system protein ParE